MTPARIVLCVLSLSVGFVQAAWQDQAAKDAAHDRTAVIFDGKTPDKLACDTTLRAMPDGSWVMVMLGGGDKEPDPRNGVYLTRSMDEGKTWSPMKPIDTGFPNRGNTIAKVPSELMVHDGNCTLFFATHDGKFGGWKEWITVSPDSCRTWSKPEPAPGRLHDRTFIRNHIVARDGRILLPFQHYLDAPGPRNPRNGVLISDDDGVSWTEHGDIRLTDDDAYRGWAENNIVELSDGRIAMIIRADRLGGVLYYAESKDGGRTWPEFATKTKIPNPGSKATLYPLGGDTVALLHNPNPKHRSPMALWISFDGLKTWPYKRVLVPESVDGPKGRLNYPDGFVSADKRWLHFAFDDNRHRAVYVGARLPDFTKEHARERPSSSSSGKPLVFYSTDTTHILSCLSPYRTAADRADGFTDDHLRASISEAGAADAHLLQPGLGWIPWWQSGAYSPTDHYETFLGEHGITKIPPIGRYLLDGGDMIRTLVDQCRKIGVRPYVSCRLNDGHYVRGLAQALERGKPAQDMSRHFWENYARYRIGPDPEDWGQGVFNWMIPEVRDHKFALIRELCANYGIAGLELDFARHWSRFPPNGTTVE